MTSDAARSFSFVQITDLHVGGSTVNSAAILIEDLRQIEAEAGDRIAFMAATGDLTDHSTEAECQMYVEAIGSCRLKVHPVVGNHDYLNGTWREPKMDAGWYQQLIAPLNDSFDLNGVHFVSYDCFAKGHWDKPSAWLLDDLGRQPKQTPIVLFIHDQLHAGFFDQLKQFRIVATLSGHWHSSRLHHDGRIAHFNSPSLCFGGIGYSPRAYRVFRWDGARLSCETVPLRQTRTEGATNRRDSELWRAPLRGEVRLASPVVTDGCVYLGLMDENVPDRGAIACWDAATGRELWRAAVPGSVKNTVAVWFGSGRPRILRKGHTAVCPYCSRWWRRRELNPRPQQTRWRLLHA